MIHRWHVELHAVELKNLWDCFARFGELCISVHQIQLRMIRPAMVCRHHPGQSIFPRLFRIRGRGVPGIATYVRLGRATLVIRCAPMAVNVGVSREPGSLRPLSVRDAESKGQSDQEQIESWFM